ncbi:MAG: hypothetical protein ACLVJK_03660 [Alistipes putredinis]
MYFPFGMSEKDDAPPATLLILGVQVLTRRGEDRMGHARYFPFGMSKEGRKMPHTLQPFLILGVQVLTRRGEDRMGHTLCISQSG